MSVYVYHEYILPPGFFSDRELNKTKFWVMLNTCTSGLRCKKRKIIECFIKDFNKPQMTGTLTQPNML